MGTSVGYVTFSLVMHDESFLTVFRVRRNRQDAIEALDLVARGKVKCHYQEKQLQDLNQ